MWDIERRFDGPITASIEDSVWTATLPPASFAESLRRLREPTLRAHRGEEGIELTLDGETLGAFATMLDAHKRGYELHHERSAKLESEAYAETGLSPDRWEFRGRSFIGRENPDEVIHTWSNDARVGSLEVGKHRDAKAAEAAIDAVPHLSGRLLEDLERVYAGGYDNHHPTHYAHLAEAGHAEVDGDRVILTEQGRETLDTDPRTLPVAVRDAIFEAVSEVSMRDGRSEPVEPLTTVEARRQFSEYFRPSGGNVEGFRRLMDNPGLELRMDWAPTEPHELLLVADGPLAEGSEAYGETILLLSPGWVGDDCELIAEAVIEYRDRIVAAADPVGPGGPRP